MRLVVGAISRLVGVCANEPLFYVGLAVVVVVIVAAVVVVVVVVVLEQVGRRS